MVLSSSSSDECSCSSFFSGHWSLVCEEAESFVVAVVVGSSGSDSEVVDVLSAAIVSSSLQKLSAGFRLQAI